MKVSTIVFDQLKNAFYIDLYEKGKRTMSDHPQAYTKFCVVKSPDHVLDLIEQEDFDPVNEKSFVPTRKSNYVVRY